MDSEIEQIETFEDDNEDNIYRLKMYKIYAKNNPGAFIIETTRQTLKQRMGLYQSKYLKYRLYGKLSRKYFNCSDVFDLFNKYGCNNCDIELIS